LKILFVLINFFLYYSLNIFDAKFIKNVIAFLFFITSFILFLLINFPKLPDYQQYFNVIGIRDNEFTLKVFFTEPYYFEIVNLLNTKFSSEFSILVFYFINTIITTLFFIWISYNKNNSKWKNIFLYSMYYYLFSFILLRNTPSYILISIMFYFINRNKYFKSALFSFFCHLSSLPVLIFSFFKNKRADLNLLIIAIGYIFIFNVLTKLEVFGIYDKLTVYQEDKDYGQNIFHKLYFFLFLSLIFYTYFKNKKLLFNYTFILIFVTYLILQSIGPVMGFRFSIYLMFYLFLNEKFFPKNNNELLKNILSVSLVILLLFNYNQLNQ